MANLNKQRLTRLISLVISGLGVTCVGLTGGSQARADTPTSLVPAEQSLLSPQPVGVGAYSQTSGRSVSVDIPAAEPIFPAVTVPVHVVIRLSDRRVYVYRGEDLEASFPVAIGRAGWETPVGEFHVFNMLENPSWTNPFTDEVVPPGPTNPLGERWIAFWTDGTNQIGFHGTPDRASVGQAASHGCIRLYDEDVRSLYQLVTVGTMVTVEP